MSSTSRFGRVDVPRRMIFGLAVAEKRKLLVKKRCRDGEELADAVALRLLLVLVILKSPVCMAMSPCDLPEASKRDPSSSKMAISDRPGLPPCGSPATRGRDTVPRLAGGVVSSMTGPTAIIRCFTSIGRAAAWIMCAATSVVARHSSGGQQAVELRGHHVRVVTPWRSMSASISSGPTCP